MKSKQELEASIRTLRHELDAITGAEEEAANRALMGKCYRTRNNYSLPEKASDYWWLYTKVVGLSKDRSLQTLSFEDDKRGRLLVQSRDHSMRQTIERYEEITPAAFAKAWARFLGRVSAAGLDAASS